MKHHYFFPLLAAALTFGTAGALRAQTIDLLEDFEGYAIDSTVYRYQISGSACKAVVAAMLTSRSSRRAAAIMRRPSRSLSSAEGIAPVSAA